MYFTMKVPKGGEFAAQVFLQFAATAIKRDSNLEVLSLFVRLLLLRYCIF